MRKRDWAGTVIVSALAALAAYLHSHEVAVLILGLVVVLAAVVIAYDVGAERHRGQSRGADSQPAMHVRVEAGGTFVAGNQYATGSEGGRSAGKRLSPVNVISFETEGTLSAAVGAERSYLVTLPLSGGTIGVPAGSTVQAQPKGETSDTFRSDAHPSASCVALCTG